MDAFGYLSVLLSIVLGLALTQLLTTAGRLIKARDRVVFYAPTVIWMGVLFAVIVQSWWTMFGLREHQAWTMVDFLVVLAHPTLLYVMVELISPDVAAEGPIRLRDAYFRHAPLFFGATMLVIAISFVRPLVLNGELSHPLDVAFHLAVFTLALIAAVWRNPRYHALLAPVMAVAMAAYIGVLFLDLR